MPEADVGVDERERAAARREGSERGAVEGGEVVPEVGKTLSEVGTRPLLAVGRPSIPAEMVKGGGVGRAAPLCESSLEDESAGERCLRGVNESGWS